MRQVAPRRPRWIGFISLALLVCGWPALTAADRPLGRVIDWFGKKPSEPIRRGVQEDAHRQLEIHVELAWLADPVTFPYYLEARVDKNTLEIRGYVPSKAVRDQVIKIARLQTTLGIGDGMREHPSIAVRPHQLPPAQLQAAAQTALKEAFPKHVNHLGVQCTRDGKAIIRGAVRTSEEKLAVSHALRRLHGCACVVNLVEIVPQGFLPPAPLVTPEMADPSAQSGQTSLVTGAQVKLSPPVSIKPPPARLGPIVTEPAQLSLPLGEPHVSRGVLIEHPEEGKSADSLALRLTKKIEQICPGAKNVQVRLLPNQTIAIELNVQNLENQRDFAGRIFSLNELQTYRIDLNIIAPAK